MGLPDEPWGKKNTYTYSAHTQVIFSFRNVLLMMNIKKWVEVDRWDIYFTFR